MKKLFLLLSIIGIFGIAQTSFTSNIRIRPGFQEVKVGGEFPAYVQVQVENTDLTYFVRGKIVVDLWPANLIEDYETSFPLGTSETRRPISNRYTDHDGVEHLLITKFIKFPYKIHKDDVRKVFTIRITPSENGKLYMIAGVGEAYGYSDIIPEEGENFLITLDKGSVILGEDGPSVVDFLKRDSLVLIPEPLYAGNFREGSVIIPSGTMVFEAEESDPPHIVGLIEDESGEGVTDDEETEEVEEGADVHDEEDIEDSGDEGGEEDDYVFFENGEQNIGENTQIEYVGIAGVIKNNLLVFILSIAVIILVTVLGTVLFVKNKK